MYPRPVQWSAGHKEKPMHTEQKAAPRYCTAHQNTATPLSVEPLKQAIADITRAIEELDAAESAQSRENQVDVYLSPGLDIDPDAASELHGN